MRHGSSFCPLGVYRKPCWKTIPEHLEKKLIDADDRQQLPVSQHDDVFSQALPQHAIHDQAVELEQADEFPWEVSEMLRVAGRDMCEERGECCQLRRRLGRA